VDLTTIWPYALAGVLLLALIILVLLVVLLKRASKSAEYPEPGDELPEEEPDAKADAQAGEPSEDEDEDAANAVGPRTAFRRAGRFVRRSTAADRHEVPFFLLAGAAGSRESDLLATTGLELPFGDPAGDKMAMGRGRGFWFFDRGIVLDIAGDAILRRDGKTADDGEWAVILRQLEKFRPKRPIDGVILTISAAELLDAAGDELRRADMTARAGKVYRRLAEAQNRLGFRLPTYVLITGCQALTGFTSLCASLSSDSRQEILGWSNPYGIDVAYRGAWVDEAFSAVTTRLEDVQMEVFTEGTTRGDELLQLPNAMRRLAVPLRGALDHIFKSSAYHGALMLRGVYFCGREEITGRTAFAGDLIERKVFAESTLATPTARTIMTRNRSVRIARGIAASLALLFAFGLTWAYFKFARQNAELKDFLQSSTNAAVWVDANVAKQQLPEAEMQRRANDVLLGMSKISFGHYGALGVPSSWWMFNTMRDDLQRGIQVAFRQVIFEAVQRKLQMKAQRILDEDVASGRTGADIAIPPNATPEQMPDFVRLQKLLTDLRALETNANTFNQLTQKDRGDLRQLGAIIEYAFGTKLPDAFFQDATLYEKALRNVTYPEQFPFDRYSARKNATDLGDAFLSELYDAHPFPAQLTTLSQSLNDLSNATSWRGTADTSPFANVTNQMRAIEVELSGPQLEWAFRRDFNLGQQVEDAFREMQRSPFIGATVAADERTKARTRWVEFQRSRLTVESPLTSSILALDTDRRPTMHLSPDSLMLKTALETFLGQGFVSAQRTERQLEWQPQGGLRLTWDNQLLQRAQNVVQSYDRFHDTTLKRFPFDLQKVIDQVARDRARMEMVDLLAQAASYEPVAPAVSAAMLEDEIRTDVARFGNSVNDVGAVMEDFDRIGATDDRNNIANVETAEAYRLLQRVERLLASDAPYRVRQGNFAWWDGSAPPSPAAWGAADPGELAAYLEVSRTRVALLSRNYAQPLLAWLAKARTKDRPDVRDLVTKWQGINDDLRDYESKKPGNPIAGIEEYITNQMSKVSTANCSAASLASLPRSAHGFYWTALTDLSSQLASRCYAVAGKDAGARYADLARYFNQRLSGRYPFADAVPKAGEPEADPDDLRNFFKLFDASQGVIRSLPEDGGLGTEFVSARQFVDEMARVRAFMAPFLDATKADTLPSWDVEPTFRVLTERELGGNQIIEWKLSFDADSLTNRDKTKKLRWTTGKPVHIAMRWANDALTVPANVGGSIFGTLRGRTVTYDYNNRWSLITALYDHRAALQALPKFVDVDPVTLGFTIPTQAAAGGAPAEKTQVFLRLALLAPGTTQPLDLPKFPTRAPRLEKTTSTAEASR
jgi:type VI secretion system protein ImpL